MDSPQNATHSLPNAADESLLPRTVYVNSSYKESDEIKVYKKRWYLLVVYCSVTVSQSLAWNTFGPIQATARAVYRWNGDVIDLVAAWGSITYCVAMAPFAWLLGAKGG